MEKIIYKDVTIEMLLTVLLQYSFVSNALMATKKGASLFGRESILPQNDGLKKNLIIIA